MATIRKLLPLINSLVPFMAMVKVSMRSLGLILPELLVSRARKMFLSTISASHLREVLLVDQP